MNWTQGLTEANLYEDVCINQRKTERAFSSVNSLLNVSN